MTTPPEFWIERHPYIVLHSSTFCDWIVVDLDNNVAFRSDSKKECQDWAHEKTHEAIS